ncbi:MAG: SDR family oxidoreductase [Ignavibacteriae bacterium]|nr:SDR family oxidoreductase [Ignavibacteriota bacterium]
MSYLSELFSLDGKVAFVVGGSGVLGGEMSIALAKAGAKVAVGYSRNAASADEKVKAIQSAGGEAMAVKSDSTSKQELQSALDAVVTRWGKVDILVNAPGVNSPTPVLDIAEEEWTRIIDTNLKGMFLACQVFGKGMIEQKSGGSIINISSVSSNIPLSRVFTYSISKAGVNNMTKFLAREWAQHGIRVNAIMPGFFPAEQNRKILTEERRNNIFRHTPMSRYGESHELAGALVWLASEKAASFVTGTIIPVDGGFTAMTI